MSTNRFWFTALAFCCFCFVTTSACADTLRINGGFTTYTGNVSGGNAAVFYQVDTVGCAGPNCPTNTGTQLCPDAGCSTSFGPATNVPLGNPREGNNSGTDIFFWAPGNTGNELSFHPANQETNVDPTGEFKLGSLTFQNGSWVDSADFGLSIFVTDFTTSKHYEFDGFLHMALTLNTGTPEQNADYLYLTDANHDALVDPLTHSIIGSVRAYELFDSPTGSNTVTVDLFGTTGSLDPTRFANPTDGGFLDSSITPALADPHGAVPEPSSLVLMFAGAVAIFIKARARRRDSLNSRI